VTAEIGVVGVDGFEAELEVEAKEMADMADMVVERCRGVEGGDRSGSASDSDSVSGGGGRGFHRDGGLQLEVRADEDGRKDDEMLLELEWDGT
jgi:hypothetical protein